MTGARLESLWPNRLRLYLEACEKPWMASVQSATVESHTLRHSEPVKAAGTQ